MPTIQDVVEWHVMIDIETLSVAPNAFITSISAQKFTLSQIGTTALPCKVWLLDPWTEQAGAVIDPDTVIWRQNQAESSKTDLRLSKDAYTPLDVALHELRVFIEGVKGVWANSPDFDLTILNNAARRLAQKPVAPFFKSRDVRTAKFLLEAATGAVVTLDNDHTPLQDCRNQINKVVIPLYEKLYERRTTGSTEGARGLSCGESTGGTERGSSYPD